MPNAKLPRLIAITGQEGSGKDSYGDYLAERGYMHVSAGDVIRAHARTQGYADPIPRDVLSLVGDALKKEFGPSPITESTLTNYTQRQAEFPAGLVISGLRRMGELLAFKDRGARALWIAAEADRRFAYQGKRSRSDRQDFEDFVARSEKEYLGTTEGGPSGVNLRAIEALADCRVTNDASLKSLFQNADSALSQV